MNKPLTAATITLVAPSCSCHSPQRHLVYCFTTVAHIHIHTHTSPFCAPNAPKHWLNKWPQVAPDVLSSEATVAEFWSKREKKKKFQTVKNFPPADIKMDRAAFERGEAGGGAGGEVNIKRSAKNRHEIRFKDHKACLQREEDALR